MYLTGCGHADTQDGAAPASAASAQPEQLPDRDLAEIRDALDRGDTTSVRLVQAYLARIEAIDRSGPRLRSVLSLNPNALDQAKALDEERQSKGPRGPLHGVPILIKDNIETLDPLPTTAGSLALSENVTGRDAPVVARLRAAGAIVLGKTNLSEWANIRSSHSSSGWSAVGGQTKNPHVLDRSPCGSSSGSGVAVAANLAGGALGTETDGSVVCPSALNGIVGLKPTLGLVSRTHIVPISHSQDTAGPMTRSVTGAAMMLGAMVGTDPADPATKGADQRRKDYLQDLKPDALSGVRVGVMRFLSDYHDPTEAVFNRALEDLQAAGATLVEIESPPFDLGVLDGPELEVLLTELKADLNGYLASTPPAVTTRTLKDLIAFNRAHAADEMPFFAQELFDLAQAKPGLQDPAYVAARDANKRRAGPEGIDAMLRQHDVDVLVAPTMHPAWSIDPVIGDHFLGAASTLAAISGYPHLTVPMGFVHGLPVGLSFMGTAFSEQQLLGYGYAFEQRSQARRPPRMVSTLDNVPESGAHMGH